MAKLRTEQVEKKAGDIEGFVVTYNDTDTVNITSGFVMANGKEYTLAADTTHDMTSLASAFDHHYIYIDDDASTAPVATIIDSTTEPTKVIEPNGVVTWYNGDDRMIGAVISKDGASEIAYFNSITISNKLIRNEFGQATLPSLALAMNPTAIWQVPNTNDGDVITPVCAIEIKVFMGNSDSGSTVGLYATNKEQGDVETSVINGLSLYFLYSTGLVSLSYFALSASRKVYLSGSDNDDNDLNMELIGYGYLR